MNVTNLESGLKFKELGPDVRNILYGGLLETMK